MPAKPPKSSEPAKAPESKSEMLTGRTALVTGGGAGIGRAITLELAAMGAKVILCGRRRALLDDAALSISSSGGEALVLEGDITAPDFLTRLDALSSAVDVVVHNATAFPTFGSLEEIPFTQIEHLYDVVVLAQMRISAHVLPGMKQRGFGRLVYLGSIAATIGAERQAPYASAKAALSGLVKCLALEGARHGVTCNLVEPGLVLTERVREHLDPARRQKLIESTPMHRPGTIEEVAAVVCFLCSPRASYVTGATIPVTGGLGLGLF